MGTKYVGGIEFVTEECASCGMPFAMTADFRQRRLQDRQSFFCPAGHSQVYTGKSQEQKLRDELERKQRELEAESGRAAMLEQQRNTLERSYSRMRKRVKNGVCPCCNRTFQNLLQHMRTEHPDFDSHQQLRALRDAFGLTQSALGEEIGISGAYISAYENQRPVPAYATARIERWVGSHDE